MTKLDYISDVICATGFDLRRVDTVDGVASILKTLRNVATELEAIERRMRGPNGGELVENPHPAPIMPPQGSKVDPISAIRALQAKA